MFGIDDVLMGGAAGLLSQAPQMLFNARQAAISRDWQENMANTQIQRRVADAAAAGINPIFAISGGSGAAVGGGAQASVGPGPDLLSSAKQASIMSDQVKQAHWDQRRSMYDAEFSLERAREQSTSAAEASRRYDAAIRSDQFEKEARAAAESANQEELFQRDAGQTSRYIGSVVAPGVSSAVGIRRVLEPGVRGRGLR